MVWSNPVLINSNRWGIVVKVNLTVSATNLFNAGAPVTNFMRQTPTGRQQSSARQEISAIPKLKYRVHKISY
jgi:hypothetical protein